MPTPGKLRLEEMQRPEMLHIDHQNLDNAGFGGKTDKSLNCYL